MSKRPGSTIELGDTLGHPNEPDVRYARLVGIRKDECRPLEWYVFHCYRDGDGRWPTGEYRTSWLIQPWRGQ
jgi:hypothetical protein